MMIKFNFELKSTPNRKGMYTVMLRITENRKHKRIITPVEVARVSDWNAKRQQVKNIADHSVQLNNLLFDFKANAIKTYGEMKEEEPVSAASLKRHLKLDAEKHPLLQFCEERITELNNARQFGSAKKYQDAVNKLEAFLTSKGCVDLLITEFDFAMLEQFQDYLSGLPNRKKPGGSLAVNSKVKILKVLRAILNEAQKKDIIKANPMQGIVLREENAPQRHLSDSEFEKLRNAPFSVGSGMDKARDLFVAAYYMAGMRFGDILSLRWNNITFGDDAVRLNYVMIKNHKSVSLKIHEDLISLLMKYRTKETKPDDYVFGLLDSKESYASYKNYSDIQTMPKSEHLKLFNAINSRESLINKELKQCADMIGIPPFSFHSSRRAFVNKANEAGVHCTELQQLLKHSSLSTTERYIKDIDTKAQDEAIDKAFSLDTKEKEAQSLVKRLINMGYKKSDIKRLWDDVSGISKGSRRVEAVFSNNR